MVDFGPVRVSQLKAEKDAVLTALSSGRRVLLSRHGDVVASIDPPAPAHADLLFDFVTPTPSGGRQVPELTSTDIGQGSPAAAIRDAENGVATVVTHRGKVYGVLSAAPEPVPLDVVYARQESIDQFLERNPDATPEELADYAGSIVAASEPGAEAVTYAVDPASPLRVHDFLEFKQRVLGELVASRNEVSFLATAAKAVPDLLRLIDVSPAPRTSDTRSTDQQGGRQVGAAP